MRTIPNLDALLRPVDEVINRLFIPAFSEDYYCSVDKRKLLGLTTRVPSSVSPWSHRGKFLSEQLSGKYKLD